MITTWDALTDQPVTGIAGHRRIPAATPVAAPARGHSGRLCSVPRFISPIQILYSPPLGKWVMLAHGNIQNGACRLRTPVPLAPRGATPHRKPATLVRHPRRAPRLERWPPRSFANSLVPCDGFLRGNYSVRLCVRRLRWHPRRPDCAAVWLGHGALMACPVLGISRLRYLGNREQRIAAMQAFVSIRKQAAETPDAVEVVRRLRSGDRVDRLAAK